MLWPVIGPLPQMSHTRAIRNGPTENESETNGGEERET